MSTQRPHYCPPEVTEANLAFGRRLTEINREMNLKQWKLAKLFVLNVGILSLSGYALFLGAAPTFIGGLTIVALLLLNGFEVAEILDALAAVREAQARQTRTSEDGGED